MEKCCKVAALYLATLKAIYIIHQQNHWLTAGKDFYGNHLLFQRLYESAQESTDLAAEKFLGLFGEDSLNFSLQAELLNKILTRFKGMAENKAHMSLAIEKDFLKLSEGAYKAFEEQDAMTQGLDDMILSIASKREESIYLLQQSLKKS